MRRATVLIGVAIVFIATLSGCARRDPASDSGGRAAFDNAAIADKDLPEVVITAPRPWSKTIVLSERGAGATPR